MNSVSDETYSCLSCGSLSGSPITQCTQCEGNVLSARSLRRRGWWLIILGLMISIFFAVVIVKQAINVAHSGDPDAKVRYTAGPGMITFMFGVFALVLFIGICFVAGGIWQVRYGRPNTKVLAMAIGIFSLLMTIAYLIQFFR